MVDTFDPRHFADVNQAFNAGFKLHESTVAHHIHHGSLNLGIDRILLNHSVPRILTQLFEAEGDFFFFPIDIQDRHFDFLVNVDHFRWMANSFPTHIGDMEQAVDSTQIHKSAKLGNVLDDAGARLSDF